MRATRPLGRVISWLDGRGRPFDRQITRELGEDFLAEHIGHGASMMTIGQILRLQAESPERLAAARHIGFVGDVIVGRLCGRRAHDPTSLAIAMLYNPWLGRADPEVLARLRTQRRAIARSAAGHHAGRTDFSAEASRQTGPATGHSRLAGHPRPVRGFARRGRRSHEGDVTFGAGTAWVLLANSARLCAPSPKKPSSARIPSSGLYGQMLSMGNGGSAIQWVLNLLGRGEASADAVDRLAGRVAARQRRAVLLAAAGHASAEGDDVSDVSQREAGSPASRWPMGRAICSGRWSKGWPANWRGT